MIRPMTPADRGPVLDLIRETEFFRPDEVQVAEELIDITLGHPGQRDYDIVVIETSSMPHYEPTRKFYLGLEYRETARIPDFYQPGDDRVIYTKRLV